MARSSFFGSSFSRLTYSANLEKEDLKNEDLNKTNGFVVLIAGLSDGTVINIPNGVEEEVWCEILLKFPFRPISRT